MQALRHIRESFSLNNSCPDITTTWTRDPTAGFSPRNTNQVAPPPLVPQFDGQGDGDAAWLRASPKGMKSQSQSQSQLWKQLLLIAELKGSEKSEKVRCYSHNAMSSEAAERSWPRPIRERKHEGEVKVKEQNGRWKLMNVGRLKKISWTSPCAPTKQPIDFFLTCNLLTDLVLLF